MITEFKIIRTPVTHERAREQYQRYLTLVAPIEELWRPKWMGKGSGKPMSFEAFMEQSRMLIAEALS
jgi:hypothetical protein